MITSISNLAWNLDQTETVLPLLKQYGFQYIEIAPSKIVTDGAFTKSARRRIHEYRHVVEKNEMKITSIQSVLYGLGANLFGTNSEREAIQRRLIDVIEMASSIDCQHIVLGSPKNRMNFDQGLMPQIGEFFAEIEKIAAEHNVVIGLEGNSRKYGNTFLTNANQVVEFISQFGSKYLKCNYDLGNELMENQDIFEISKFYNSISQIQLSMPYLKPIEKSLDLERFLVFLDKENVDIRISIEMLCEDLEVLQNTLNYLGRIFGD